jgi:hypothetical protein
MLGTGAYKVIKLMVNVENVLSKQVKELKTKPSTRVIHVRTTDIRTPNDSGVK